ncbi:unnamed protein product [Cercopithifilaria johnstoni]|uniref:Uncharacterized protein n=1 Tax=Cercopithifilaria johnstoni TaxID=2874296 RepID=A0A8J2M4R7_9BILA|nr:unnamed protein product [Cercopithifilaria johnstoni]
MNSSQDSASVDRMPHLKQLVLSSDDGTSTSEQDVGIPYEVLKNRDSVVSRNWECQNNANSGYESPIYEKNDSLNSMPANGVPDTPLGQAVTNLYASWVQLISDLSARTGYLPPTLEHIKEVAECAVRQLKDSCHDLTREFARVGLEWRLTHPNEALAEDLADYDQAILRQESLLERAAGIIERRLNDLATEKSSQEFE